MSYEIWAYRAICGQKHKNRTDSTPDVQYIGPRELQMHSSAGDAQQCECLGAGSNLTFKERRGAYLDAAATL